MKFMDPFPVVNGNYRLYDYAITIFADGQKKTDGGKTELDPDYKELI